MEVKKLLKILVDQYRRLKEDGSFSTLAVWWNFLRILFYGVFRREECADMLNYRFIKFKHPDIYETMFTLKDNARLLPLVNDEAGLSILREKHQLLQILGGAGRRYFYVPDHSEGELTAFLLEGEEGQYILKPDGAAGSEGISFLYTDGEKYYVESGDHGWDRREAELETLYQELKSKNILIEEYIKQHDQLNEVYPGCVNTFLIHTVRLPDGHAEVAGFLYAEFGCGNSRFVNSRDDLVIGIHGDGTLYPYGFWRKDGHANPVKVTKHPDSGIVFEGFRIPYWSQAVRLALDCAEKIPQLVYIKWDLAITQDGPVIIEGNGMPGGYRSGQTYSLEARHIGVKAERTEFLKALAFSKTLTPEKVQEVNQAVAGSGGGCTPEECDAVVVFGSTRSTSRIETAFRTFGHDPSMRYILCGGGISAHPKDSSTPEGEKLTEAEYMERFLLERGVRKEQIVMDNASKNTKENLTCAAGAISRIGVKNVALVSAWFHGRRVMDMAVNSGVLGLPLSCICFVPAYGEDTKPDNWFKSLYGIKAIYHEWKDCGGVNNV